MPLSASSFASLRAFLSTSRHVRSFPATSAVDDCITEVMRQHANDHLQEWQTHLQQQQQSTSVMTWTSREEASAYVEEHIDAILLDCDGVLYRGLDVTPEAPECLSRLMDKGKQLFFVTNNAGQNRRQLRDKLISILDCPKLTEEQMISSSYSCAQYLYKQLPQQGRVHVIGTQGLCEELSRTGFQVSTADDDDHHGMNRDELAAHNFDVLGQVDAVVVGLDTDFSYRKLCVANVLLQRNPEALFVATNTDAFDLVGADARHLPGNGALVKALEHASQRTAINVGKPSKVLAELIQNQHNLDPSRTLMVGDRLDTDIRFGVEGGMKSALVLTGCVRPQDLIDLDTSGATREEPLPDIIMPYMGLMA